VACISLYSVSCPELHDDLHGRRHSGLHPHTASAHFSDLAPLLLDVGVQSHAGCESETMHMGSENSTSDLINRRNKRAMRLEGFSVDGVLARLFVLLFGDPHLFESGQIGENGATDPGRDAAQPHRERAKVSGEPRGVGSQTDKTYMRSGGAIILILVSRGASLRTSLSSRSPNPSKHVEPPAKTMSPYSDRRTSKSHLLTHKARSHTHIRTHPSKDDSTHFPPTHLLMALTRHWWMPTYSRPTSAGLNSTSGARARPAGQSIHENSTQLRPAQSVRE
jgi:hypothetical protein